MSHDPFQEGGDSLPGIKFTDVGDKATGQIIAMRQVVDKDINGAVVTEVANDGPAADKRLQPGDVITEAGEKEVLGAADISARVDEARKANKNSILLLVSKGGKQADMRFIALKIRD